jgi:predicted MarR family transcription regulator
MDGVWACGPCISSFKHKVSPPALAFAHGRLEEKRRSLNMPAELIESWATGSKTKR